MNQCKKGGDHEPIEVAGHWYCRKCNKPVNEPGRKKK